MPLTFREKEELSLEGPSAQSNKCSSFRIYHALPYLKLKAGENNVLVSATEWLYGCQYTVYTTFHLVSPSGQNFIFHKITTKLSDLK